MSADVDVKSEFRGTASIPTFHADTTAPVAFIYSHFLLYLTTTTTTTTTTKSKDLKDCHAPQ
jgi:hypothetical protein